ncbi:MAG: hypothetical protein V4654_13870 [Bdellovibrionota bacterium]
MKKLIFTLITLTATLSLATTATTQDTTDLMVEGVHCATCTKMISKKVCADAKLSENFESCGVTVVDSKKQIGKISLRLKEGKTLDTAAIDAAVKSAGDKYIVKFPETKK